MEISIGVFFALLCCMVVDKFNRSKPICFRERMRAFPQVVANIAFQERIAGNSHYIAGKAFFKSRGSCQTTKLLRQRIRIGILGGTAYQNLPGRNGCQ